MDQPQLGKKPNGGLFNWLVTGVGRIIISLFVPIVTFIFLWQGFLFLRDTQMSQILMVIFAIVWGVGGVSLLFFASNWFVERLPGAWTARLQPFVFVGPGIAILSWYLAIPTVRTFFYSLYNETGRIFVGLENYKFALTDQKMLEAFRNNMLWLVFGTIFCVGLGLIIAVMADRTRLESLYKSIIFLPMAISFVGAGVIWKFMYTYKGEGYGIEEIGLLNAAIIALGGQSQPWLQTPPWNNYLLIIIMIWLQTGYCMVILSSAIKGISSEMLEAARVDGATEVQVFFRIIIPAIQGTILMVTTTIVIFSLKLFDIVRVMTGGNYHTNVIANEFYLQRFTYGSSGRAAAIAIVLLLTVVPIMVYNLRQFRERKAFG
jgi:alpha-glucoside transport system permease protein